MRHDRPQDQDYLACYIFPRDDEEEEEPPREMEHWRQAINTL